MATTRRFYLSTIYILSSAIIILGSRRRNTARVTIYLVIFSVKNQLAHFYRVNRDCSTSVQRRARASLLRGQFRIILFVIFSRYIHTRARVDTNNADNPLQTHKQFTYDNRAQKNAVRRDDGGDHDDVIRAHAKHKRIIVVIICVGRWMSHARRPRM
jgi:hypothetical protein